MSTCTQLISTNEQMALQGRSRSSYLRHANKDVGGLLLQEVMEGILPGLLEQLVLDSDERGLAETLQGQDHPVGQQAVHQDSARRVQPVTTQIWRTRLFPSTLTKSYDGGKIKKFLDTSCICDVLYCAEFR